MRTIACALLGVLLLVSCTPVPPDTSEEQSTQPAAIEDIGTFPTEGLLDTSDWETYRNEEYGFEFRYPNNWTTEERSEIPYIHAYSSNNEGVVFLPRGELDRGLHFLAKNEKWIRIGNKEAKKIIWSDEKTSDQVACWYQFPEAPASSWMVPDNEGKNGNRIEVSCDQSAQIDTLLNSIRFF